MPSCQPPARYEPDEANRVRRIAYRATYEASVVHAILDSGYVCHISSIDEGLPQVIPMSYWRDGEFVYFHSGARSRFARVCRTEPVAISVTSMDGLVLGHSPINHSINYRSVVVHGRPEAIDDRQAKATAMQSFFDKTIPGRWDDLRAVRDDELDALTVFRVRLDQVAAKIRNEFPDSEDHMPDRPVWTGTVPLRPTFLPPVADPRFDAQPTPPYLASFSGKPDFASRIEREHIARSEASSTTDIRELLRGLKSLPGPYAPFDVTQAPAEPEALFLDWLKSAIEAGVREPHSMTLSTVDADGRPDARVLILKNVDEHGWHFAITRRSPKGRQIAHTAQVALTFYWPALGRQVRIRGVAKEMGPEVRAADFLARPHGSRAGALIGRQSDVLASDQELEDGLAEQLERLKEDPQLVSPQWAVYAVRPDTVEFWQAHEQRRHLRLRYRRNGSAWTTERLWP